MNLIFFFKLIIFIKLNFFGRFDREFKKYFFFYFFSGGFSRNSGSFSGSSVSGSRFIEFKRLVGVVVIRWKIIVEIW